MSPPTRPPSHVMRGIVLRVGAGLCFGIMAALVKLVANMGAGLAEIIFYRSSVGLIVVLAWVLSRDGLAGLAPRRPMALLSCSALALIGMFAALESMILLPLAEAITVSFTGPIFATLLSWLILHERVGRHRWLAALVCFAGVLVVMRPGSGGEAVSPLGVAVGLGGAMFSAGVMIAVRNMAGSESVGAIVFWFLVCCVLAGALLMAFTGTVPGWEIVLILAAAGLVASMGQIAVTASIHSAPIGVLVPFDYLLLIWAVLLGWLLFSTEPTIYTWTGATLIVCSGLYTFWREQRHVRQSAMPETVAPPLV